MRLALLVASCALAACNPFKAQDPLFQEGVTAYGEGKYSDAEQAFDRALSADPSSEGHLARGLSAYRQGKHEEAAGDLRRVLTSDNDDLKARAWLDLGNTSAKQGKLDDAVQAYRRSLELSPKDPDALYNLEWALQAKKQQDQQQGDSDDKKQDGAPDDQQNKGDGKGDDGGQQAKNDSSKGGDNGPDGKEGEQTPDGDSGTGKDQGQQADNQNPPPPDGEQGEQQGDEGKEQQDAQAQSEGKEPGGEQGEQLAQGGAGGQEQPQGANIKPLDAQEIDQVLDSLQASEKNLQMWRFQDKRKDQRRTPGGKDW